MRLNPSRAKARRTGALIVEFAVLLPLLMFFFGIGVDFARAFYAQIICANAARNAAVYGSSDPDRAANTAAIIAIARRDLGDLGSAADVAVSKTTDASGNSYVNVKVTYPFQTVTPFVPVASPLNINQNAEAKILPTAPKT